MGEQLATGTETRQGAGTCGFRTLGLQPRPVRAELPSGEGWSENRGFTLGPITSLRRLPYPYSPGSLRYRGSISGRCCNGIIPLNCEKWKCSTFSHVWRFVTPWTVAPTGSSVQGILQARILVWVAIPFSRGSSWPRDQTHVSCLAGRFFTVGATMKLCVWNEDCFGKVIKSIPSSGKWTHTQFCLTVSGLIKPFLWPRGSLNPRYHIKVWAVLKTLNAIC